MAFGHSSTSPPTACGSPGVPYSEVNFRLSEFAANVPHLAAGFENLVGTILDGELVCPKAVVDTGDTVTTHPLQAAVAILATTPENAKAIQEAQDCRLRFVAFDVLRFRGMDTTIEPLRERLTILDTAYLMAENPHLGLTETLTADKGLFHELLIAEGKEGSVWKRLDEPYSCRQASPPLAQAEEGHRGRSGRHRVQAWRSGSG